MSQLGVKLVSFNEAKMVGRILATGFDFVIVTGKRSRVLQNGVACMGRRRKRVAQRWVSSSDNGGLQKWRITAGWGDFVISDGDLRVEREGCERPLLIENGWRVRRLVQREEKMRRVADVQPEAFYFPMTFFCGFFFEIFKGEVLAGLLLYRIRNSAPNRYACLVAETDGKLDPQAETHPRLVGVVDITVLRDDSVLQFLEEADEYLYVSGIAVLTAFSAMETADRTEEERLQRCCSNPAT